MAFAAAAAPSLRDRRWWLRDRRWWPAGTAESCPNPTSPWQRSSTPALSSFPTASPNSSSTLQLPSCDKPSSFTQEEINNKLTTIIAKLHSIETQEKEIAELNNKLNKTIEKLDSLETQENKDLDNKLNDAIAKLVNFETQVIVKLDSLSAQEETKNLDNKINDIVAKLDSLETRTQENKDLHNKLSTIIKKLDSFDSKKIKDPKLFAKLDGFETETMKQLNNLHQAMADIDEQHHDDHIRLQELLFPDTVADGEDDSDEPSSGEESPTDDKTEQIQ